MSKRISPAEGDRIDLGGKKPQIDIFASLIYRELVNNNLVWIKVGDPEAEKLDDIQYATRTEIHAYQVKWSNLHEPEPFSFNDFKPLLFECISGWKTLDVLYKSQHRKVVAHLLTNRPLSSHDSIKLKDETNKIGSFAEFVIDVWCKIKVGFTIDAKWQPVLQELISDSNLSEHDFLNFVNFFDFHYEYRQEEFSISNVCSSKKEEDLIYISRFLLEELSDKNKTIEYSSHELVLALGSEWEFRFKTTFNHELVIDRKFYQPVTSTLEQINLKLNEFNSGYLFLVGGPGTGKSTLLTDWSNGNAYRIIKYYAFDFSHPSSSSNDHERGEAMNLYFDLVFQLKPIIKNIEDAQPYKDLTYLKGVFSRQLNALGEEFKINGKKTVIIIDGLDHIPREYFQINNTLLAHLPNPKSIPNGVYIVLGSQSYELNDLKLDVKLEFQNGARNVKMDSLNRKDVFAYLNLFVNDISLSDDQKQKIFDKSQGHPLYLRYLMSKILQTTEVDSIINEFEVIDGDIDVYYKKIWSPISGNSDLVDLFGLISRINGEVSFKFINEWKFEKSLLSDFRKNAKFVFNDSIVGLSFFHNSFRQFLIRNTSLNPLTLEFDGNENKKFHYRLAEFYKVSTHERTWKMGYHLFKAEKYDDFLLAVTPDELSKQFISFRPFIEIQRDIKLGIEISKKQRNVYLLVRYLFSLSELQIRLRNINPIDFIEELIKIGDISVAKTFIRNGSVLLCNQDLAFKAARQFLINGEREEAGIIYNIAEPSFLSKDRIILSDKFRYDEYQSILSEWVKVAPFFESTTDIVSKILNIESTTEFIETSFEDISTLQLELFEGLCYSLIKKGDWNDFEKIILDFDLSDKHCANFVFGAMKYAIESLVRNQNFDEARRYLALLLKMYPLEKAKPKTKIYIADLIYTLTQNTEQFIDWIEEIPQPEMPKSTELGFSSSLDVFMPRIMLNKLLNHSGKGIPITIAVPNAVQGSNEEVLVDFERMLCLITKLWCEGLDKNSVSIQSIENRISPIVKYYYKDFLIRNSYWHSLTQRKSAYYDFLISSVSTLGKQVINEIGDYLVKEFTRMPEYWPISTRRDVLISLFNNGYEKDKVKTQLKNIEPASLESFDLNYVMEESINQIRAFSRIEDSIETRNWIEYAFTRSLGVENRENYQFSPWISWLIKTNNSEPEFCEERIKLFLSHLNYIENSLDGGSSSYVAEEILNATFKWNFTNGVKQLKWQLDNGLVSFQSAWLIFIENYIESSKSVDELKSIIGVYFDIVLFVFPYSTDKIISLYLRKCKNIGDTKFIHSQICRLIDEIDVKVLDRTRFGLLMAINDFCFDNKINLFDLKPDFDLDNYKDPYKNSNSPNILVLLENNERLTESEVILRCNDFSSFKKLLRLMDKKNSHFNWETILEKVIQNFTLRELKELSMMEHFVRRESHFYSVLSHRALALGDEDFAETLAERAISYSNNYGWVKWYDGGSRIFAFEALKKVDTEKGTSKAFDFFVHDAISHSDVDVVCQQFSNILPCISNDYKIGLIWTEIKEHLDRLMQNGIQANILPEFSVHDFTLSENLTDLLIYCCRCRINVVSQNAKKHLSLITTSNSTSSIAQLKRMLFGDEVDREILVNILVLFEILNKQDVLMQFCEELKELAVSSNYQIRFFSNQVMKGLGFEVPIAENKPLPELYSIYLKQDSNKVIKSKLDQLGMRIDLSDPEDLIKPFGVYLDILNRMTKINRINLVYRMNSLMAVVDDPNNWTDLRSKEIEGYLDKIGLKYYRYSQPRAIAAKRALMLLITELIDAGIFFSLSQIHDVFKLNDFCIYFLPEKIKPNHVPNLMKKGNYLDEEWVLRVNECERLIEGFISFDSSSSFIIGEYTELYELGWSKPREKYSMKITDSDLDISREASFFGSVFEVLIEEYYLTDTRSLNFIIRSNHHFDQFDLKSRWLAFNPNLARELNWGPESNYQFGWKDDKGELMVYSIYWLNGNVDIPPPQSDAEVGCGWIVVATEKAIRIIKDKYSKLMLNKAVSRSLKNDGKLIEKSYSNSITFS